jgi:4-amino-4-deoxy-L-arabinose transferase-like glycosyltransferase
MPAAVPERPVAPPRGLARLRLLTTARLEAAAADINARTPEHERARWFHHLIAIALLIGMGALMLLSMRDESPTTDETVHLTRGVSFYWGEAASLSYAHPPLGNALTALPIVIDEPHQDVTKADGYDLGQVERVARALLEEHYPERRKWFFEARAAVALIALLMAGYAYLLGNALFGPIAGLVGLGFVALHPTLIAHGRSMTTDMPVTAAMLFCTGETVLYLIGRARWHALVAALMFGAAVTTKYTALALLPVLGLLAIACAWFGLGRYAGIPRKRALLSTALFALLVCATGLLSINAIYRFDRTGLRVDQILQLPEPMNQITRGYNGSLLERRSVLKHLPGWFRMPVPFTYVYGLTSISVHDRGGHLSTFFGKTYRKGHPAYFPVLLAIKTPLLSLAGLFFAGAICWRRRGRVNLGAWLLAAYAGILLLLAMRSGINIGIRHILPVLPVLGILSGAGAVAAFRAVGRSQLRNGVVACLAAAHVLGLAWCYPDYISDFNALVGGRVGGEKISIVGEEWGQDMVRLGTALQERGVKVLRYNTDTFTSGLELARFDVRVERLACPKKAPLNVWVGVNARERARFPECLTWLPKRDPDVVINNHIWLFKLPKRL